MKKWTRFWFLILCPGCPVPFLLQSPSIGDKLWMNEWNFIYHGNSEWNFRGFVVTKNKIWGSLFYSFIWHFPLRPLILLLAKSFLPCFTYSFTCFSSLLFKCPTRSSRRAVSDWTAKLWTGFGSSTMYHAELAVQAWPEQNVCFCGSADEGVCRRQISPNVALDGDEQSFLKRLLHN